MFKKNDKVRENRQMSKVLTVMEVTGNMIFTFEGVTLHVTKTRRV